MADALPSNTELTPEQAAELLNVSRLFLVGLLDDGKIEHRKVGEHRRIRVRSLQAYLQSDELLRREAAAELSSLNRDMGLL